MMLFKDNQFQNKYLFSDLETYGLSYYMQHGYTKPYACYLTSKDLGIEIFDVDIDKYLQKIFVAVKDDYQKIKEKTNYIIYFHNGSGFDFKFFLSKIYDHFKNKNITPFWFKNKDIYFIKIKVKSKKKTIYQITFACSYLIFRTSVEKMGESLGYEKIKGYNYDMTDIFDSNEDFIRHDNGLSFKYLKRDVEILQKFFYTYKGIHHDYFKLTNGSTAMKFLYEVSPIFKDQSRWLMKKGDKNYTIDLWNKLKSAHVGGFCYVNPKYQLKLVHNVRVYDFNSLYAAVMKNKKLPYGYPTFYKDKGYDYTFHEVKITLAKTDKIPFFADKDRLSDYIDFKNRYLQKFYHKKESENLYKVDEFEDTILDEKYNSVLRDQTILMDKYQLEYFEKNYKGKWVKTFFCAFKEKEGLFDEYINYWADLKINFEKSGNMVGRQFAKEQAILPNGKFGQTIYNQRTDMCKVEDLKEYLYSLHKKDPNFSFTYKKTDIGEYIIQTYLPLNVEYARATLKRTGDFYYFSLFFDVNTRPNFLPMAISILSQARRMLFDQINKNQDAFIYADTDSVHLLDTAIDDKDIDQYKFGYLKDEGFFANAIYRRPKHYLHVGLVIEDINQYLKSLQKKDVNFIYSYQKIDNQEYIVKKDINKKSEDQKIKLERSKDESKLIDPTFYELKGGGFNVKYFNDTKSITLKDYLQDEFKVKNGKRIKLNLASGTVLAEVDYVFKMPLAYYKYREKQNE